jgi:hypothetical protein
MGLLPLLAAPLLALSVARADAVDLAFSGYLDARVIAPAGETSWVKGGLGKFRFGPDRWPERNEAGRRGGRALPASVIHAQGEESGGCAPGGRRSDTTEIVRPNPLSRVGDQYWKSFDALTTKSRNAATRLDWRRASA